MGRQFGHFMGAVLGILIVILMLFIAFSGPRPGIADEETESCCTIYTPEGDAIRISVELADTPAERETGLMYRSELAEDAGMLFVYPRPTRCSFWMKNTWIPLDIAFLASDFSVLELFENQTPLSTADIVPRDACIYVLEVNGGFFRRHSLLPSDDLSDIHISCDITE